MRRWRNEKAEPQRGLSQSLASAGVREVVIGSQGSMGKLTRTVSVMATSSEEPSLVGSVSTRMSELEVASKDAGLAWRGWRVYASLLCSGGGLECVSTRIEPLLPAIHCIPIRL